MHGSLKVTAIAVLAIASAAGCTRRVVVESEPNRYEAAAPAELDISGVYDFVVEVGDQDAVGEMTITRSSAGAGWDVAMTSNMGGVYPSNIRRSGNTLTMDAETPGGPGTIELTWLSRDEVTGMVFLGEVYNMTATRRP